MKKGYTYTIIFIITVTIVFTGLLAVVNAAYKNKIEKNEETAEKESILYSMGIETGENDINELFDTKVSEQTMKELTYYSAEADSGLTVYSIPFEGPGLWGTIRGYVGIDESFDTIEGIAFTEQNETPGLGGRIDEEWYKEQYRGAEIGEVLSYGGESGLDAITGATSTSNAVLKIINNLIETTLTELEETHEK